MGEASTLNNMGRVYNDLGQHDKAIEVLNQALPMWRQTNNRAGEASTLDNLGRCYSDMGRSQEALDNLNQALPLWRAVGEMGGEAQTLNNLGRTYTNLGEKEKALESYQAALPLGANSAIPRAKPPRSTPSAAFTTIWARDSRGSIITTRRCPSGNKSVTAAA